MRRTLLIRRLRSGFELRADALDQIRVFVEFFRGFATFLAANQESGTLRVQLFIALHDLNCEKLLHLFKFGRLDDRLLLLRKKRDLTLGMHHAVVEKGMRAEPACSYDISFLAGHLVEEAYETVGIVSGLPGVLNAELVRFGLIIAAHAEQVEVDSESQAVEPVLQGVICRDAARSSGQDDR